MKILFIQTGGTIDKDYPQGENNHGYNFEIAEPAFNRILRRAKPSFEFETLSAVQKDSLDITDEDRQKIYDVCKNSNIDKIIVTHGTDTMLQTAEYLNNIGSKIIVLCGSMQPELFKNTDADFNLGSAVGTINYLSPGVYIAMSGMVLPWDQVIFDPKTSHFDVKKVS